MKYILLSEPYEKFLQETRRRSHSSHYKAEFDLTNFDNGFVTIKSGRLSLTVPEGCVAPLKPSPHPIVYESCPLPYPIGAIVDVLFVKMRIIGRSYSGEWSYRCEPIGFDCYWAPEGGHVPHSWIQLID